MEEVESRGSREPCGLKSYRLVNVREEPKSRLARALWIEIAVPICGGPVPGVEARESLVD